MTPQNIREFWNVCTRAVDHNGLGLSVAAAERHTQFLERHFTVLPDSEATYREWRSLLVTYEVRGKQVHDTYLVGAMKAHGVGQILTFNEGDFSRFQGAGIVTLQPEDECEPGERLVK